MRPICTIKVVQFPTYKLSHLTAMWNFYSTLNLTSVIVRLGQCLLIITFVYFSLLLPTQTNGCSPLIIPCGFFTRYLHGKIPHPKITQNVSKILLINLVISLIISKLRLL